MDERVREKQNKRIHTNTLYEEQKNASSNFIEGPNKRFSQVLMAKNEQL